MSRTVADFKPGDRVVVVKYDVIGMVVVGLAGTVTNDTRPDDLYVEVRLDNSPIDDGTYDLLLFEPDEIVPA